MPQRARSVGRYRPDDVCSIDGCEKPPRSRGWCSRHYDRWRDHGDPLGGKPIQRRPNGSEAPKCAVEECPDPARSRGYCAVHWSRMKRHGDARRVRPSAEDRFWAKVDRSSGFVSEVRPDLGECWLYTGGLSRGYGVFWNEDRKSVSAHRFAYELEHGPIPSDLSLDHLCYTRNCVRSTHLEPVPIGENVRRSRGKVHFIVLRA